MSDSVLFIWSLVDTIDEEGEKLFSYLFAQGLPAAVHAVMVKILDHRSYSEVTTVSLSVKKVFFARWLLEFSFANFSQLHAAYAVYKARCTAIPFILEV